MADGSIRVNTKLDTTEAKADLKKLEKECEKAAQKIQEAGQKTKSAFAGDTGIKKFGQDCETAADKIGKVGQTAQAVFTGMNKGQLNSAFKTANKELTKTEEKLAAVEAKIAEVQAGTDQMLPFATTDEQAANLLEMEKAQTAPLNAEREKLTAQATEYKNQLQAITAELEKQTQEEAAQNALKTAGKDAVAGEKFLGKIETEAQYHAALRQTQAEMAAIEQQAARIAQQTGVPISSLLTQNSQYQSLASRQELLIANQDRYRGKVSVSTKEVEKLGTSMTRAFSRGFKRITKLTVGILGARSAFLVLRRAASTYMEANQDLKNQVDGVWNVLAAAIGPAIQTVVNWLTIGISYINAFVKALWGIDLVARGNALALNKQAKATSTAAAATKKAQNQLAGFDEMNKLSDTSADGGSSGAAGGDVGEFKPVEVDTKGVEKFINILKEIAPLVAGIGAGILAWKIASLFTDNLKTVSGVALLVAGAVTTIWSFCDAWVNGLDWGNLLTMMVGIGAAVGGAALLFGTMGAAITAIVGGIALVVIGFKDWLDNGKSVEALAAITAGLLAIGAGLALIFEWPALIVAAVAALVVAVVMYWDEICAALKKAWDWICDLFSGIGKWIYDNVIKPVCDFFVGLWGDIKDIFSAIGEWFSNVFTGAWEGIKTAWSAVCEWFANLWQGIKDVFSAIGEWFSGVFSAAWEGIKTAWSAVITWFSNLWIGIKNVFSAVGEWFKGVFTTAWTNIKTAWSAVKEWFKNLWTGIKEVFSVIGTWFKETFTTAWTNIKTAWSKVKEWFSNLWAGIKEVFGKIGTWFKEKFEQAWTNIKTAWSAVKEWFKNLWAGIKEIFSVVGTWFKEKFSAAWTNIKTAWGKVKEWFKNLWTGIKDVFGKVKDWFKEKFSQAWTAIKNVFSGVGSFFSGIWNTIKEKFSSIGSSIGNAIGGAFKKVVNSIISFAETTINGFIKAINGAINLINKIPGVNIKTLNLLSIPRLAKGGIVNNPGQGVLATIGEAGKEAVLPLENNTEWMDILADRLNAVGQKIVVPIYLNGRKIAEEVIDLTQKRNFATNGGAI